MIKKVFSAFLAMATGCMCMAFGTGCSEQKKHVMYQVTPNADMLMNCYVIKTKNDKLIVIDGGGAGSPQVSGYLYAELQRISGKNEPEIEAWFLSHMHDDHVNELVLIAKDKYKKITVNNIYFNFPSREFMQKAEDGRFYKYYDRIQTSYDRFMGEGAFEKTNGKTAFEGDVIDIDGVKFEILLTVTDEEKESNINDTSMIFRTTIDGQTIMFLGDAYIPEGKRLLEKYGDELKSDIVQMAHHGQNGVDKDVYEAINPTLCLWPAPHWVFNNTNGNLQSFEVRQWMMDLGVKYHIVAGIHSTQKLEFPVDFDSMDELDITHKP